MNSLSLSLRVYVAGENKDAHSCRRRSLRISPRIFEDMLYIWAERLGVLIARVALTNAVRVLQSFAVIVHDGSTADLGLLTVELMRYRWTQPMLFSMLFSYIHSVCLQTKWHLNAIILIHAMYYVYVTYHSEMRNKHNHDFDEKMIQFQQRALLVDYKVPEIRAKS